MMQRLAFAGVVHWAPPEGALDLAAELIRDKGISAYGPCAGLPALAGALQQKLANENALPGVISAKSCLRDTSLLRKSMGMPGGIW